MKISMINVVQHRELPADFTDRYHSIWVDLPWHELATPQQYERFYWDSLDEMLYAVDRGFDGIALNEHHQNAFGGLPNPNIFAGALAHATRDRDVALVQMGSTLPTTHRRTASPRSTRCSTCSAAGGSSPVCPWARPWTAPSVTGCRRSTQRERYYEAHDLIIKAWTATEPFPWNGKYFQLPCVNIWPRPVQQPHPPIWVPGHGQPEHVGLRRRPDDHAYMVLTAFSGQLGITDSIRLVKGFWDRAEAHGRDRNPFRAGIALMPIVGDSMAQIERDYFEHIRYTFDGHDPHRARAPQPTRLPGLQGPAQHPPALPAGRRTRPAARSARDGSTTGRFKDYVDNEIVVAGTAAEVAERIEHYVREMNAGHLMVMLQLGSMPKELTFQSIDAFAEGVLPRLRPLFEGEWENRWWPERLRAPRSETEAIGATRR